jgi:hypothetical protein
MSDAGYWLEPAVISGTECDESVAALSSSRRSRAGVRHLMSHPAVAAIANDPRLQSIALKALGSAAIPFRATLFEKTGDKNWLIAWHQDTALPLESKFNAPGWGPWSEKDRITYAHAPASALERVIALRLHLDASASTNGPLRVIPNTHRSGVLDDDAVLARVKKGPQVDCPAPRGSILAMCPLLIHASPKAASADPRRVLHIEYTDSLELQPGVRIRVV